MNSTAEKPRFAPAIHALPTSARFDRSDGDRDLYRDCLGCYWAVLPNGAAVFLDEDI